MEEITTTTDATYNSVAQPNQRDEAVQRVLLAVLAANLAVTVVKITLGLLTGALAVLADGFHSLVDSSSNLIGLTAIKLARRPADDRHPYGYRRYETVGALAIGGLLLVAAWEVGRAVVGRVLGGVQLEVSLLLVGLVALTLPLNLLIVILETRFGRRLNSEILLADAAHTRTDLWITLSVLAALLGAWMGWGWLDLLVAGAVVLLILRAAVALLRDSAAGLADAVVVDAGQVEQIARNVSGVSYVHQVRSRGTLDSGYVDLHVKVHPGMSTVQAHGIASEVERRLVAELPNIVDALVHIEPAMQQSSEWQRMAYDLRLIADGIGVGLHDLHIHAHPSDGYAIEMHLEIPGDATLAQAHDLAETFEQRVHRHWPQAASVITHLEPLAEVLLPGEVVPDPRLVMQVEHVLAELVGAEHVLEVQWRHTHEQPGVAIRLCLSAALPLADAHACAERIERVLMTRFPMLYRVIVHVEPCNTR